MVRHLWPSPQRPARVVVMGAGGFVGDALARRLERQRLLIDLVGRIGTAEAARLGLVPDDMARLADLMDRASRGRPSVAREVLAWRRTFSGLRFV